MTIYAQVIHPALAAHFAPRYEGKNSSGCLLVWDDGCDFAVLPRTTALSNEKTLAPFASTSSSLSLWGRSEVMVQSSDTTACSPAEVGVDDRVPSMLAGLKRMTGWSWERVAEALGRSRQAVHGWTLGREISQPNLEHLAKLHATISFIDRGNSEQNRALLHSPSADGRLVSDLINEQKFEDVKRLLGEGGGRHDKSVRQRIMAVALRDDSEEHWFDRLAETPSGVQQPLEIIPSGERKRVVVRRRE